MVITVLCPGLLGGSKQPSAGDKDDHFIRADSKKMIDTTAAAKVADVTQKAKTDTLN